VRSSLLKTLIRHRLNERVRGGHRLARLLARNLHSAPIAIDGFTPLYVDLSELDDHAMSLYRAAPLPEVPHERALTEVFRQIVEPGDTVFDVGANLGLHSLTFSKLARQVVAFEPNRALLPNLRRTIAHVPNVTLQEICLSESDGTVEFHVSEWDHMLGSLANWTGQPTKTLAVPARTLDSLIAEGEVPKPQVLKVDVEGAELLVFRGAEQLLSGPDAPRAIVFEELNSASRKLGISDGAAAEFIRQRGYFLYLIDDNGLTPLTETRPPAANLLATKKI
jgi:FkbM family methyltransferase